MILIMTYFHMMILMMIMCLYIYTYKDILLWHYDDNVYIYVYIMIKWYHDNTDTSDMYHISFEIYVPDMVTKIYIKWRWSYSDGIVWVCIYIHSVHLWIYFICVSECVSYTWYVTHTYIYIYIHMTTIWYTYVFIYRYKHFYLTCVSYMCIVYVFCMFLHVHMCR